MSLVARITLLILAALVPFLALEGYNQHALRAARIADVHAQARRTAELVGRNVLTLVENTRALLITVAHLTPATEMDTTVCSERLAGLLPTYPQYRNIAVLDRNGQVLCTTARTLPAGGVNLSDRAYMREATATRDFVFAPFMISPVSGTAIMPSVYPIPAGDGTIRGYVIVTIDLEWVSNYLAEPLPKKSTAVIANRAGTILATSGDRQAQVGTPISPALASFIGRDHAGTAELGENGSGAIVGYVNLPYGLFVTAETDSATALRAIDETTYVEWAITLGTILAAVLASLAVGFRTITRPVRRLVSTVRRWSEGDLSARAEQRRGGADLAYLGAGLNDMMARLQARETELRRLNAALGAVVDEQTRMIEKEVEARREAEASLQHSRRLEAIGQLTGGVAHDFNNLLTIIMNGIRRAEKFFDDPGKRIKALEMAIHGAERAAALTARLLAFSRRQPLEPRVLQANRLVSSLTEMLRRTLGEQVQLETVIGSGLWNTLADPSQLESAILNLALNARDAMPNGGKLTIETANASLDEAYAGVHADVVAGQYVMIAVTDTGTGMTPDVVSRAFEPFYTTKEEGQGSGLGLSQVYGFVKQSGGHVKIYSEPGEGTTVRIYLPRSRQSEAEADERATSVADLPQDLVVLLVEDDPDVRGVISNMLTDLKCVVIEVADGWAASKVLGNFGRELDLLLCDVILGGEMNGRAVADEAARLRPGLPVLFMSGYTRNAIVHNGRLDDGVNLLSKPFSADELQAKMIEVLGPALKPRQGAGRESA